jgi:hypothetical protein
MKVKIGDTWYSDDDVAICVELTAKDKSNIFHMAATARKYAAFPDNDQRTADERLEWMKE